MTQLRLVINRTAVSLGEAEDKVRYGEQLKM